MTQTGQNSAVRTQDEQAAVLMQVICDAGWKPEDAHACALRELAEAEARGAEEQRRKDAQMSRAELYCRKQNDALARTPERADIVQWQEDQREFFQSNVLEIVSEYAAWRDRKDAAGQDPVAYYAELATMRDAETGEYSGWEWRLSDRPFCVPEGSIREYLELYPRAANVAALEASVKVLEAEKADAVWTVLTGNTSSDPKLPSCRLSLLFQEGDTFPRFKQAAEEFGIEVILKSDEREEEDWDKELSAEMLARLDQHKDLIADGWSFVDVWDDDDGNIIRLFARPIHATLNLPASASPEPIDYLSEPGPGEGSGMREGGV